MTSYAKEPLLQLKLSPHLKDVAHYPYVVLLGLQNTGTNLLTHYLEQYTNSQHLTEGYWKHEVVKPTRPLEYAPYRDRRVLKIILMKHPLFWLQSTYKSRYEIQSYARVNELNTFVMSPMYITATRIRYKNPAEYWLIFHYNALQQFDGQPTIWIHYEDLLNYPDKIIKHLQHYLGKPVAKTIPMTPSLTPTQLQQLMHYQTQQRLSGANGATRRVGTAGAQLSRPIIMQRMPQLPPQRSAAGITPVITSNIVPLSSAAKKHGASRDRNQSLQFYNDPRNMIRPFRDDVLDTLDHLFNPKALRPFLYV